MHFLIRTTKVLMSPCVFYFLKVGSLKMLLLYSYFSQKILTSTVIRQKCESQNMFQENKAHQIFRKANISYHLTCTRTCVYQGVRNARFSENLACFVLLKHPFWDLPFFHINDDLLTAKITPYVTNCLWVLRDDSFRDVFRTLSKIKKWSVLQK